MKKSPHKVIELFIYALILIAAIIWTLNRSEHKEAIEVKPIPTQTQRATEKPNYNIPPKGEFLPIH